MTDYSSIVESQPLVSVIMNCYNGEEFLQEAIDSVFCQTYQNWELILWDNASIDRTSEICQENSKESRFKYYRAVENSSLGKARNKAINCAKGEFLAFLDCDDRWLPTKLQKQLELFHDNPKIDLVYGNFYFTHFGKKKLNLGFKRRQNEGCIFHKLLRYFSINLQTVVLRKSKLEKLPELFDEKLSLAEDYDLFLRYLYDSKAGYLHEPLIIYRIHERMSSIRHAQKYPNELIYCVSKLKNLYPNLEKIYPREINYLEGKIAFWQARAAVANGEPALGRSLLSPHCFKSPLFFLLYCGSFLPARLWLKLQELRLYLR